MRKLFFAMLIALAMTIGMFTPATQTEAATKVTVNEPTGAQWTLYEGETYVIRVKGTKKNCTLYVNPRTVYETTPDAETGFPIKTGQTTTGDEPLWVDGDTEHYDGFDITRLNKYTFAITATEVEKAGKSVWIAIEYPTGKKKGMTKDVIKLSQRFVNAGEPTEFILNVGSGCLKTQYVLAGHILHWNKGPYFSYRVTARNANIKKMTVSGYIENGVECEVNVENRTIKVSMDKALRENWYKSRGLELEGKDHDDCYEAYTELVENAIKNFTVKVTLDNGKKYTIKLGGDVKPWMEDEIDAAAQLSEFQDHDTFDDYINKRLFRSYREARYKADGYNYAAYNQGFTDARIKRLQNLETGIIMDLYTTGAVKDTKVMLKVHKIVTDYINALDLTYENPGYYDTKYLQGNAPTFEVVAVDQKSMLLEYQDYAIYWGAIMAEEAKYDDYDEDELEAMGIELTGTYDDEETPAWLDQIGNAAIEEARRRRAAVVEYNEKLYNKAISAMEQIIDSYGIDPHSYGETTYKLPWE